MRKASKTVVGRCNGMERPSFVEGAKASCGPEKACQSCCPQRTDSRLSVDTMTGVDRLHHQHPHERNGIHYI